MEFEWKIQKLPNFEIFVSKCPICRTNLDLCRISEYFHVQAHRTRWPRSREIRPETCEIWRASRFVDHKWRKIESKIEKTELLTFSKHQLWLSVCHLFFDSRNFSNRMLTRRGNDSRKNQFQSKKSNLFWIDKSVTSKNKHFFS